MVLLDTSFLIEFEEELDQRRVGPARRFIAENRSEPFGVSVIAIGEFAEGCESPWEAELFLRKFKKANLSDGIALLYGVLQDSLPQRLGDNDAWIAATAIYNGWRLVGRDAAFERISQLKYVEI